MPREARVALPPARTRRRLPPQWERRLLLFGGALLVALFVEAAIIWFFDPSMARALLLGVGAEVVTGREGGIAMALSGDVPAPIVFQVSATQDLAAFCLAFPLFLILLHRYHERDGFLMRKLRSVEDAAARHGKYVRRWGPLGLFAFMLLPFLVNGPLVAGVVGRLAGIRTRYLIAPVVAGTLVAAAAWTFLYRETLELLGSIDPRLPRLLSVAILLALLLVMAGSWVRERWSAGRRPRGGERVEGLQVEEAEERGRGGRG